MAPTTAELFARRPTGVFRTSDYVAWALTQLEAGADTPALRVLAGLDDANNVFDTEQWVTRAVDELGLTPPTDPLRDYARDVAERLLAGNIDAASAVKAMYWICVESGHADRYYAWSHLDDILADLEAQGWTHGHATPETFPDLVREEARALLEEPQ